MKKILSICLFLSGCATVPSYKKCTVIMRVDETSCYNTCLTYSRHSLKSDNVGINNNFLACLNDVCGSANVCLQNNEPSPLKENLGSIDQ